MNDSETTLQELKDLLKEFRDKRDWEQFHDPKNLAEAISIEVGELMEHFLWKDREKVIEELKTNQKFREEVSGELADIFAFAIHFANATNLDIASIIKDKVQKADKKYPVEKSKGNATKWDKL